jgi:hypothetical protein
MSNKRVEWRHSGKRLILPVAIMPRDDADNRFETFRTYGLLDTGATGTGLRPDAAEHLSLTSQGRRRIETANGILWASEYVIRVGLFSGDLGLDGAGSTDRLPYILDGHFIGFELPAGFTYPVLIGMDIISQCDLHVMRDGTARIDLP